MGLRHLGRRDEHRADPVLDLSDLWAYYSFGGQQYGPLMTTWGQNGSEPIANSFVGYASGAHSIDAVVFACVRVRTAVFSEARFQYRRFQNGRPGDLFGDPSLRILEQPWPGGTTGELLARMEQDVSLAGNFYAVHRRAERRLYRLRPDWVSIVVASPNGAETPGDDPDAYVAGYQYQPNHTGQTWTFTTDEVVHYSPIPDPLAHWRGMSWLTPVLREIESDVGAGKHLSRFWDNAATPNLAVSLAKEVSASEFDRFKTLMDAEHGGADRAWKTLFLGGGASVTRIGSGIAELDYKNVQGKLETRIANAAGVHPVVIGLSEGLAGSALNAGNYTQARRNFADGTMRPLWRIAAASLASVVPVPAGAELWYDDRDIAFLREDAADEAKVRQTDADTIRTLVEAGMDPQSAIEAVVSGDFSKLAHTGLVSVQLQEPNSPPALPAARTLELVRDDNGTITGMEVHDGVG